MAIEKMTFKVFSHDMSMGAKQYWGVANWDTSGMVGRTRVGNH